VSYTIPDCPCCSPCECCSGPLPGFEITISGIVDNPFSSNCDCSGLNGSWCVTPLFDPCGGLYLVNDVTGDCDDPADDNEDLELSWEITDNFDGTCTLFWQVTLVGGGEGDVTSGSITFDKGDPCSGLTDTAEDVPDPGYYCDWTGATITIAIC